MFAVIIGSGSSNPMTSLNNSRDSFVFTLQVFYCSDRKNGSYISVYASTSERNETPSTDDNMAPADFKQTGQQVATSHTSSRNYFALSLRQITCKIFKDSVSTTTIIQNIFLFWLSHYYYFLLSSKLTVSTTNHTSCIRRVRKIAKRDY
jgi:hypothetical protein